ncbi:MurR/RpiR family transcriptional regulator [Staphylococcus muscae]|uniref:Transcriptional regulator n=1 Tax=Staphylococcus muscae TaxID=1294 RepID=A0A240BTJ7_9STAP|nr:MurR/RpiR family transcriptional regulator [Staphylococcus muscae]AVQ34166.1 MurR/RpiR family transcriptional regulator [Staphylococcus muscae]PNZ03483.1 MurR/RpiR family transcriptional regulator [Staphylococcus muscae]GGA85585.1 RpiR family transcriptional regulator [Staphylococcus muscae]SNV99181.1 transcriptional regulator [Staphylococcus muscae]
MKIENRIQKYRHILTKTDQKIATYIMKLKDNADMSTIHAMAMSVDVSPSSITRFVYKLGYDSFQSFRFAILHEQQTEKIDNSPSIQVLHQHYMSILNHTGEFIVEDDLMYLVQAIQESEKVIFIGIGSSGLSAQEFYFRTARMGFNTIAITDAHLMAIIGQMCNPHTTIVALTNSGATKEIITSIAHGRASGAKVIALSHFETDILTRHCTRIITTADKRHTHDTYFINSQLSNQFIIDLVSYHLLQDPTCLEHYSKSHHELMSKHSHSKNSNDFTQ